MVYPQPQVFDGVRVLDLTQGMAGPLAAMLFADNGADVVKVEPPTGDWARRLPGFAMWNRGKRSVALDLSTTAGVDRARELAATADVVISDLRAGSAAAHALAPQAVRESNADVIHCSLTGFGLAGRHETVRGYESVVAAACGRLMGNDILSGAQPTKDPVEPTYIAAPIGSYGAAMLAVQGITAALYRRGRGGGGDSLTTSLLDGVAACTMRLRFQRSGDGIVPVQALSDRALMFKGIALTFMTAECADGRFIQMCARQDHHFRNWLRALGVEHLLDEERFAGAPMRFASASDVDDLDALLRDRMKTRTMAEWMRLFTDDYDVGADPFLTPAEFLEHPQMTMNGRVAQIDDPILGPTLQVGPLMLFSATPSQIARPAPRLDEHAGELDAMLTRRPAPSPTAADVPTVPFEGATIVELATFLAAPLGATVAAELGARVIKVEPPEGDAFRRTGLEFVHLSHGKESVVIDLKRPEGRDALTQLVRRADVVLHNFRPGVAERLGVGYDAVRALNPQAIYVYGSSYGSVGPEAHRAAFHSTPNALSGGGIVQAGRGNPPIDDSYPDPCAGLAVGVAIAMGLLARQRHGVGQRIETSMIASTGYVHSNELVIYDDRPAPLVSDERQLGVHPLYRAYRCADGWIFLAVLQAKERAALSAVLGMPAVDELELIGTAADVAADDLQAALERAFSSADVASWHERLVDAGVPAAPADRCTFEEFMAGEHLLHEATHPAFGDYWRLPPRIRFACATTRQGAAAACGEHTLAVLGEVAGDRLDVPALQAAGVVRQWDDDSDRRGSLSASGKGT